jgi:hypothetical protein
MYRLRLFPRRQRGANIHPKGTRVGFALASFLGMKWRPARKPLKMGAIRARGWRHPKHDWNQESAQESNQQ